MTGSNQNPTSDQWVRDDSRRMLDDERREKLRRHGPLPSLLGMIRDRLHAKEEFQPPAEGITKKQG